MEELFKSSKEIAEMNSQNLLRSVKVLTKAGFAVLKSETISDNNLLIQCMYIGSPRKTGDSTLSMDGISDAFTA